MQSAQNFVTITRANQNSLITAEMTVNLSQYCQSIDYKSNWQNIKNQIGAEIDKISAALYFFQIVGDIEANKNFLWFSILSGGSFAEILKNSCDAKLKQFLEKKINAQKSIVKLNFEIRKEEFLHTLIISDNSGGFSSSKIESQNSYFDRIKKYELELESLSESRKTPDHKYLFGGAGKGLDIMTSSFLTGAVRDGSKWREIYDLNDQPASKIKFSNSEYGAMIEISCTANICPKGRGLLNLHSEEEFILLENTDAENVEPSELSTAKKSPVRIPVTKRIARVSPFKLFLANINSSPKLKSPLISNNNTPTKN
jgi:hypothetical protein